MKKIGIMGGTFNPIHNGHLLLAQTAYRNFHLDNVLFMPNNNPAYKDKTILASDRDRLEMTRLAISDNEAFSLSTIEFEREGNTYTVDTLNILTEEHADTEYYFIMGADSLFDFDSWRKPDEILKKSILLVAGRNQISKAAMKAKIQYLHNKYEYGKIYLLDTPTFDISSYAIRTKLANGDDVKYMIPDKVIAYIEEHHLYKQI